MCWRASCCSVRTAASAAPTPSRPCRRAQGRPRPLRASKSRDGAWGRSWPQTGRWRPMPTALRA
eukprot:9735314-Lingulodinium_polyedra.AAC.1